MSLTNYTKRESQQPSYEAADVVCFSHLRWDFVFQRPQHLLSRFAKKRRVFFVEEPMRDPSRSEVEIEWIQPTVGIWRVIPQVPESLQGDNLDAEIESKLSAFFRMMRIESYLFWYYTPMALGYSRGFHPALTVYDCMDELSAFKSAPRELCVRELELFQKADLVFTGGKSLYRAKCHQHRQVYSMPSSVDTAHFGAARASLEDPEDQAGIPRPRAGFAGVIDERMDLDLLAEIAELRPKWNFVMVGPVVKIDRETLPHAPNIHYLGIRPYSLLPRYFSGWDVAILPFALNASTRFISPTKTPEYLAAGRPVVSTAIEDVVNPYFSSGLVQIARSPNEFVWALDHALKFKEDRQWLQEVDRALAGNSWDHTWDSMNALMRETFAQKHHVAASNG